MTNAKARFNVALRPQKPYGSLGRKAQDGHLDFHTAPELCFETPYKHKSPVIASVHPESASVSWPALDHKPMSVWGGGRGKRGGSGVGKETDRQTPSKYFKSPIIVSVGYILSAFRRVCRLLNTDLCQVGGGGEGGGRERGEGEGEGKRQPNTL